MASISMTNFRAIVRGIVVDREYSGETPFFSDDEITTAINLAKSSMYARKPESFLVGSDSNGISVAEPSDYFTGSMITLASWAKEPLAYLSASILLIQKSKDSFYREASDKLLEFYERSL